MVNDLATEALLEDVPCLLCRRDDAATVLYPSTLAGVEGLTLDVAAFRCTSTGYGDHFQVVQCQHCGLVYSSPRLKPDVFLRSYEAVEDDRYMAERDARVRTFRKHLRKMETIVGQPANRRLLDVGAYIGVFVDVARQVGWQAEGIEPSHWAAGQAQANGLPVRQGDLTHSDLQPESYNVVTLWDVVEHFTDPLTELDRAYALTKPGGWMVIHTIDIGSPTAKFFGAKWPFLMEMHLAYFSRATQRAMLEAAGYEFVKVHTQGRYLSAGYLANRIGAAFSQRVGNTLESGLRRLGLADWLVPINTLDLFTMYARKPSIARQPSR